VISHLLSFCHKKRQWIKGFASVLTIPFDFCL
jgi:hypothetical protein